MERIPYVVRLWWHDGEFLLATNLDPNELKKELDEYRGINPEEYNDFGFIQFVNSKGFYAESIEPDYDLYF